MRNIVKNWDTLGLYFSSIKDNVPMEQKFEVARLCEIFRDRSKYALLVFLLPIIEHCEKLNTMFQGAAGAEKAHEALQRWYVSLKNRVMRAGPIREKLPMREVDFGIAFERECCEICSGKGETELRKVEDARNRAWAFLLKLLEGAEKRLPSNMAVFKQLSFFSPASVLSSKQIRFGELPFVECVEKEDDLSEMEEQWRQVRQVVWAEATPFKDLERVPSDSVEFWFGVRSYKAGADNMSTADDMETEGDTGTHDPANVQSHDQVFFKLATFVLGRLTVAHSTAAVERTFSIVSCVKTKLRNRLATSTLEAILRCRSYLYNRSRCCKSLEPTEKMLQLFSNQMYTEEGASQVAEEVQDAELDNIEVYSYLPSVHEL